MSGQPYRILVVDDEIVIRELMTDILADEGFEVEAAPNGRVALEMLRDKARNFVVLFTDIMMPEMNGIELIHEARKVSPTLVPIVMTGFATLESARAAVKEGAYDYVLKPFNLSEIKMAVNNALERFRLANENTRLREITELFRLSENIASIREEDALLDYVLHAALERVDATRGSLMLMSADGKQLELAKSIGLPEGAPQVVQLDSSISGWVAENVRPLLVDNVTQDPDLSRRSLKLAEGSFISVPLERKAAPTGRVSLLHDASPKVIAVLNVTGKRGGHPFAETDLKVLSILANHAAAALENVYLFRDIEDGQREIVFTLGEITETRSRETGNHVKRVAEYCKILSRDCGLTQAEMEVLRLAAPLHDVGKVGIPDAILNKPGRLTPEEYEVMKSHAQIGYDMLKVAKGRVLQAAALIAHQHHERFDGSGYPRGLAGKDIHLFGRISGIADVFDALGSERVYKHAWPLDDILKLFREQRAKHFDPDIIDVFFANLDEILFIRNELPDVHDEGTTDAAQTRG